MTNHDPYEPKPEHKFSLGYGRWGAGGAIHSAISFDLPFLRSNSLTCSGKLEPGASTFMT
jgi:hypothetical protein